MDAKSIIKIAVAILISTGLATVVIASATVYFADHPQALSYTIQAYCKVEPDKRMALRKAVNDRIAPAHAEINCGD